MDKYQAWIRQQYPAYTDALGQCRQACEAMKQVFPELEITNGFVHLIDTSIAPRAHWWMKDQAGNIVDPTGHQFLEYTGSPISHYEEIDDSHPARNFPSVKCPNCGEYYYQTPEASGSSPCCTSRCYQEYVDYLNGK